MVFGMDPTVIILIPAFIFALIAQGRVNSAYNTYAKMRNRKGITGAQAARMILDQNGLWDVPIEIVQGRLADHYDPRKKIMRLSPEVYGNRSIAAVSIAAHESGHAIQHAKQYGALSVRNAILPVMNFASTLSWPLLMIGILLIFSGNRSNGNLIFNIGVLFFLVVVLFHVVTLPVEFNASKRAMAQMTDMGIIFEEESVGAKKVLSAAAMTYVAALAVAVAQLVRLLLIRGNES